MNVFLALLRKNLFKIVYYVSLLYFTYLMLLITLQYIPISFDVAFLRIKQDAIKLVHYQYAFFIHVYSSIFVLIAGIPQFSQFVRTKYRAVHRKLGMLYIALVLFVASPSGFIMALYANGGMGSKISFIIQAVLWFAFTYKAYQYARQKKWKLHENFMYRSYALTLSAISLRLLKWIIVATLALPPMDTYRIVSWAGWILNLIIIEIYLNKRTVLEK